MKQIGKTLDWKHDEITVYECEDCGSRSTNNSCFKCVREYHMEEASVGLL